MSCEDVDYLTCSIYFNENLSVEGYDYPSLKDKIALGLGLGFDPFVSILLRWQIHSDVKISNWGRGSSQ